MTYVGKVGELVLPRISCFMLNPSVWVWVGWAHKVTLTLQPFSDLSCIPIYFIPSVVPYIWQSTVSYIMETHHSHLVLQKCLPKRWNLNSAKATHSHRVCEAVSLILWHLFTVLERYTALQWGHLGFDFGGDVKPLRNIHLIQDS
jgi:hypothetical protein